MSIIRRPGLTIKNNAKWEAFQPVKIEGKDRYTQKDIAKVFSLSPVTICNILNDVPHEYNECLIKKVRAFAKEGKYGEKLAAKEQKQEHVHMNLSTRNYSSKQERYDHMLKLREDGYTNEQIAGATGYKRGNCVKDYWQTTRRIYSHVAQTRWKDAEYRQRESQGSCRSPSEKD